MLLPVWDRKLDRFLYEQIVRHLPYREGARARYWYLKKTAELHPTAYIAEGVHLVGPEHLRLEEYCSVSPGAILDARGGLEVGAHSMVGIGAIVLTSSHGHSLLEIPM